MATTKRKEQQVLDLSKYMNTQVDVKFAGGREVRGVLKGYDALVNLVLDECVETMRDPADAYRTTDSHRTLGLVVCRGTQVMLISPVDGCHPIENPYAQVHPDPSSL